MVKDYGKCPITGEFMSMDDIALIKTGKMVKPRPAQAASINGMFQTQLHTARQQLSHALYQRDAACRVIARLRKERDESRSLLAQAENRPGVAASFIEELTDGSVALSQQRKRRQIPSTLATVDAVERYTQLSSYPLHKTNTPGILAMDILYSTDIIATGGADTTAVLFNRSSGEILSTLSGHSKKVTGVKIVGQGDSVVTGPADKFDFGEHQRMGMNDCRHILKDHTAEVQAVTVHATNNYFVSASLDNTWCFYDLSSGLCLSQVDGTSGSGGFTSASFHPDGLYLGTGTSESIVQIWDVRSQANLAKFDGHVGAVTAISFSENGYFLATAAHDGVKLWDLRNSKNFKTFAPYDDDAPTQSVEFDHSGRYLAVAGSDIRESNLCEIWPRCEIPCSRINGSQPPRFRFAWGRCDGFLKYFFSYRATEGEAINITPCFWDSFMKFLFSN